MPRVSVIMPVYNREKYLGAAIESILAQTFTDFELIVVDDGSTDASAEIVQEYAERDSRVRFFRLTRNMGQSQARNHAFAASRGAFIAVMDSDDLAISRRLERQVAFLDANPGIGVVGGNLQRTDAEMNPVDRGFAPLPEAHALIVFDFAISGSIKGGTVMMRRACLDAVGGYDASLRFMEDRDLIARLIWRRSIRFANLPDYLIQYRQHDSQGSRRQDPLSRRQFDYQRWRFLESLGCDEPAETQRRMQSLKPHRKLSWSQRRQVKRDMRGLIQTLIALGMVDESDKPLLVAVMNRRLERASPRLWQKFCYWRRHRLPWLFPDRALARSAGKD